MLYPVVMSYAQLGLLDEAQSLLPKLREANVMSAPMALALARPFAQGARHEAVSALLSPLQQFTDPDLLRQALLLLTEHAQQAHMAHDLARYGEMEEALLTTPAQRTKFLTLLGQAYEAQGKPMQALQVFRRCAEVPEAGDMAETCLLRAAALHAARGQHQDALSLYERMLQLFPHSNGTPGLLFRMAESHRQQTAPAQMQAIFMQLRQNTQDTFWQKVATEYLEQAQWQERLHERLAVFQNSLMR
jgi:tetratricopeptide (TPR) repeat protein